jgi:hypothetical protein
MPPRRDSISQLKSRSFSATTPRELEEFKFSLSQLRRWSKHNNNFSAILKTVALSIFDILAEEV